MALILFFPCKKAFLRLQFAPILLSIFVCYCSTQFDNVHNFGYFNTFIYVYFYSLVALCYCLVTIFMSIFYVNYSLIIADIITCQFMLFYDTNCQFYSMPFLITSLFTLFYDCMIPSLFKLFMSFVNLALFVT